MADFGLADPKMNEELFKARTKRLALDIIELIESLPRSQTADVIGRHYFVAVLLLAQTTGRLAGASPRQMFISKLAIVEEEADEAGVRVRIFRVAYETGDRGSYG